MTTDTAQRTAIAAGWMQGDPLWWIMAETRRPLADVMATVRAMGLPERFPGGDLRPLPGTIVIGPDAHGAGAKSAPGAPLDEPSDGETKEPP